MKKTKKDICRICKKELKPGNPFKPFCSERCRLIDLGSWIQGNYRIPGEKIEDQNDGEKKKTEDG
ncbi:MAG: DNA gyrase inhibitor YacG [Nitrospirota bacterium]